MGGRAAPKSGDRGFSVSDLDCALPDDLIAQHPLPNREDSRLLVVDRATGTLNDRGVTDLPDLLTPGDLLILNDTRVLPAKFTARRRTGGRVRGLFVLEERPGDWRVMLEGSRRLRAGESLDVIAAGKAAGTMRLLDQYGQGEWRVAVNCRGTVEQVLERIGQTPLPPYIKRDNGDRTTDLEDRARYQTVYARRDGAVAAPTAGLHLTDSLLERIGEAGVVIAYVTLHVGLGTFKPIDVAEITQHEMHSERYEVTEETARGVRQCRERGGRVVAVGTTAVRTLESSAVPGLQRVVQAGSGATDLFIYPPYDFRVVDVMMTNFHLPRSTLLALVMAFAGMDLARRAYEHAIAERYRFYSYGDAMLIT